MAAVEAFAPSDPAFVAHPYDAYAVLREGPRAQYDPRTDTWLVPRHADVDALLRDRWLGRTYLHLATHAETGRPEEPPEHAPFRKVVRNGMLDVEPPDHPTTRLRRLVSRAFTVSFGAGVHFCLGAPLARIELQTSFGTVLRRMPHLELVEEPTWRTGYVIRGLQALRVRA